MAQAVKRTALTGNKAAAHALKLARIQVLCSFPNRPLRRGGRGDGADDSAWRARCEAH